ncbi:MAG: GNAT family N-acetyltransferase, partial [Xenococcaceae cyanobacterium]
LRLWLNQEKGFGYINDSVPELAIAVLPKNRGQGIGTKLITQVLKMAQKVYPAVSLSVRSDNPAIRLYQRLGFVKVEDSEKMNQTGGNSFNMIYQFSHCSMGEAEGNLAF